MCKDEHSVALALTHDRFGKVKLFDINNRKPLLSQSSHFLQWKRSREGSVLQGACMHEDQGLMEEVQLQTYVMHELDDIADKHRLHELRMADWWKSDPLTRVAQASPTSAFSPKDAADKKADFFRLDGKLSERELEGQLDMLRKGIDVVKLLSDPEYSAQKEYAEKDSDWLARMLACAPDPKSFKAGRMHACVSVLEEYFAELGNKSRNANKVISWFKEGVKFRFVGVEHKSHQHAPQFTQKMEAVKSMLTKAVGTKEVEQYLTGLTPHAVQFPNHKSVENYSRFVQEELDSCERKGVIKRWTLQKPPTVVNGLKVVDDKPEKLRLCLVPMYINSFMAYEPVKYEQLKDLVDMVEKEDYLISSDDKSGFWQVPLHPSMWKYVAFQFQDQVYTWCVNPFGIAEVPGKFTIYKQEVHRPLRQLGVRMSMLIDDRLAVESSRSRARLLSEALILIMVSIGVVLNVPDPDGKKAQWLPEKSCRYLGFIVEAQEQRFKLPKDKKEELQRSVQQTIEKDNVSNRELARVAGKMIAASPAVRLGPLFARAVYHAMIGSAGWDTVYQNQDALQADLMCFAETLSASEGTCWWKREDTFVVAGDASEIAFAAYTPNGEYSHPIVVSFKPQEMQLMADNQFSSTLREIMCMLVVTKVLLQQAPHLLRHKRMVYETDSQTGFYSIMGMKGNTSTFPVVKELRLLCASWDIEVDVVWRPREDDHQQMADFWSKVQDNSEWSLHPEVYEQVLVHPVLQGQKPTVDIFASHTTTKVPQYFYSKYACPGTSGVDAFAQPWASHPSTGRKHLAYINGPFDKMGAIVRKIKDEKVNCILIGPVWPRHWLAMLQTMPVKAEQILSGRADLCVPGPHVPMLKRVPKHPRYNMQVWYILW